MTDAILSWAPEFGLPALFVTLAIGALGVPLPGTLLLIAFGALVAQGDLSLWQVCATAAVAAVVGDQVGYVIGRLGGEPLTRRIESRPTAARSLGRAIAVADRWGAASVFLTRWLMGPLGPWVNLSSGLASYSWPRFLAWDVAGELVWVGLYVTAGMVFTDQVSAIAELSLNLAWALAALGAAALGLLWLVRSRRSNEASEADAQ
ncbi:MAG: DedA family protein [Chloroflexi bacterium]|nr:MAG: DedA family protein [Chloroflexota bacterium]